ncbi:MAG: transcriptional regulator, GntR family [Rhodoglobus sp.]|jgi:DNA-binding GntR family transcriptional regulator|nr:transcriptional regulator, GntR family [Rhodoglobus sp.]
MRGYERYAVKVEVVHTVDNVSSGEQAYRSLRRDIILGRHRPNQRLIEEELCEELGLSRTPIRQALSRLEVEGLVESHRRGWRVHEHTEGEVKEIYEVRAALEGYAARLATESATESEIGDLAAIYSEDLGSLVAGPRGRLVELNGEFHRTITKLAHNERLADLCEMNGSFAFNYQLAATYSDEEMMGSLTMHQAILAAVASGNGDEAERLAREHVMTSLRFAQRRMEATF